MKSIIIKEVKNAIQEAEYEPTATVYEHNLVNSIIQQNEEDVLNLGHQKFAVLDQSESMHKSSMIKERHERFPEELINSSHTLGTESLHNLSSSQIEIKRES